MGKPVWTGDNLWYLLNLPTSELVSKFPQYTEGTIKGKKVYWRKKLMLGEVTMPPRPEDDGKDFSGILRLHNLNPELAKELTEQGFHVGFIRNKYGEIEYTIPLPHAKGKVNHLSDFAPATPANITPSKIEPVSRPYKLLYIFSDAQIDFRRLEDGTLDPIHDERALRVGHQLVKDLQPDEIICLGDTIDLASLSRFQPDSDHFQRTLGPSFQRVHDMYAQFRSDAPNAKIIEVDSNHNTRLKNFVMRFAPNMYGLKQAGSKEKYPVLTYPFLANFAPLNIEWVSGYGAAEYIYGQEYDKPPIVFKHGNSAVNGSTATRESKENPEVNVVRGHTHRMESFYRTNRRGEYIASIIVGAMCRTTGEVPSYHSAVDDLNKVVKYQENWQQSVMVIKDYSGDYQYEHIPIINGKASYNGKEYNGNL